MLKAFTLIELMIVIAIIAIIASIAIPNLLESRITANEGAAAGSIKSSIFSSAVQFQSGTYQDSDGNGVGEFGMIQDMAGVRACLGAAAGDIGLITGQLANMTAGDRVSTSSGYNFIMYLFNQDATNRLEEGDALPTIANPITEQEAESFYLVAAAPQELNIVGRRVYLMTQDGQLRSTSLLARRDTWFNAAGLNTASSAEMDSGVNDALTDDADITTIDIAGYPFYTK